MEFNIIPNEQTPAVPDILNVRRFIASNEELLTRFLNYAASRQYAVGLAANQVSVDGERLTCRMFAMKNIKNGSWRLIFNPEILAVSGIKELKDEGCLTWENKRIISERHHVVYVKYHTMEGEIVAGEYYKGFDAQIWQHEVNHLDGIEERVEELSFKLPKQHDTGRNDKCPCDSGRKFKACCMD